MGEISDMMLDGTLCAGCGEYIGSDAGHPVYCSTCQPDYGALCGKPLDHLCPVCGKGFETHQARRDHARMKHGETP